MPARAAGAATQASEPSPPATTSPSGFERDGLVARRRAANSLTSRPVAAQAIGDLVRVAEPESGFASRAIERIVSDLKTQEHVSG